MLFGVFGSRVQGSYCECTILFLNIARFARAMVATLWGETRSRILWTRIDTYLVTHTISMEAGLVRPWAVLANLPPPCGYLRQFPYHIAHVRHVDVIYATKTAILLGAHIFPKLFIIGRSQTIHA